MPVRQLAPIPPPDVHVVDQNGKMTVDWYLYFKARDGLGIANLSDVSGTAPANTQVLIFNAATKLWTPAAN